MFEFSTHYNMIPSWFSPKNGAIEVKHERNVSPLTSLLLGVEILLQIMDIDRLVCLFLSENNLVSLSRAYSALSASAATFVFLVNHVHKLVCDTISE